MKNGWLSAVLCAAALAAAGARQDIPAQYRTVRELRLGRNDVESASNMRRVGAGWLVDADFFSTVDDLHADWRALTPDGRPAPFQIERVERLTDLRVRHEPAEARIVKTGRVLGDGEDADAQIVEFEFDAGAGELWAIDLMIGDELFERLAAVEAEESPGVWTCIVPPQPLIGDSLRDVGEPVRIYFSHPVTARRLRLVITAFSDAAGATAPPELLEVKRLRGFRRVVQESEGAPVLTRYRVRALASEELPGEGAAEPGVGYFEARRVPLSQLRVRTPLRGFSFPAELYGSDDLNAWRTLAGTRLYGSEDGVGNLSIDFGEQRFRYYRLVLHGCSDEQWAQLHFDWLGAAYVAIFPGAPERLLLYCGGDTERPDYPRRAFSAEQLLDSIAYRAEPPEANSAYRPLEMPGGIRGFSVWIALGVAVCGVGLLLGATMRRLKNAADAP